MPDKIDRDAISDTRVDSLEISRPPAEYDWNSTHFLALDGTAYDEALSKVAEEA
jgi:hypothetical protein